MSTWQVNLVTAFGRGETLALALKDHGFDVTVFDFTSAFPEHYSRGVGPFPLAVKSAIPHQQAALKVLEPLKEGLVFWLKSGPLELSGPMVSHFASRFPALKVLKDGDVSDEFREDWLRRFLSQWASPFHFESWETPRLDRFPYEADLGLWPDDADFNPNFQRFARTGKYVKATRMIDVQIERSRITEFEIEGGQTRAVRAPQWVWFLSSSETKRLSNEVANVIFNREVRKAEWQWLGLRGRAERGPWTTGFPKFSVVLNDEALPWAYGNMVLLRWLDNENFVAWIKVPAASLSDVNARARWRNEVAMNLNERLPQAKFSLDEEAWSVCPHSAVLESRTREWKQPGWRNWDWIAPETLPRLDWTARFAREAESLERLIQWRNEMIKKQGAQSDSAIHAP